MSAATYVGRDFALELTRDEVRFETSGRPVLDPSWSYADPAGHVHSSLETLEWAVTLSGWCEQCQDEHDEGEYRCKECGAAVEPDYVFTAPESHVVPGLAEGRLRMNDGRTYWLRGDDFTIPWGPDGPSREWIERVTQRDPDELVIVAA